MKNLRLSVFMSVVGLSVVLMGSLSPGLAGEAQCEDDGVLSVLTINLLFSEVALREARLNTIAEYVKANPVDLILMQEVVGGPLSGTFNSALDLKNKLAEGVDGIEYNLRYRLANGLPGVLTVGNAILSRCKILFTLARTLPIVTEEPFHGLQIPLRRKAMMVRIRKPGFGRINVYNTHLCAFCDSGERLTQAEEFLDFIDDVESFIWWDHNPIILGGDFNSQPDQPVYNLITSTGGFTDTYADTNTCEPADCCDEVTGDGCTFGRPDNPFAVDPKRIDYIFSEGLDPQSSEIVFTEDDGFGFVSDHSAVRADF